MSGRIGEIRPQVVPRDQLDGVLDRLAAEPKRPLVRAALFWLWWDAYDADRHVVERIIDLLDEQADPSALPSDAVGIGLRRARFALTYGDAEGALRIVQRRPGPRRRPAPGEPARRGGPRGVAALRAGAPPGLHRGGGTDTDPPRKPAARGHELGRYCREPRRRPCHGRQPRPRGGAHADRPGLGELYVHITTGCDLVTLLVARGRAGEAEELLASILEQQLPGPGDAGFRFGLTSQVVAARAAFSRARAILRRPATCCSRCWPIPT